MSHEPSESLAPVRDAAHGTPSSPSLPETQSTAEIAQARPEREIAPRCAHRACACPATPDSDWCSDACRDAQQGKSGMTSCPCRHPDCVARQETDDEPRSAA